MDKPDTLNERIGVLERREVEARILAPLVEKLSARFGADQVRELLGEVILEEAKKSGRAMRQASQDEGLESFAAGWEPWFRGGALEIEELERNEGVWRFNVVRCRYAELYRSLGMADLGATLSCNRDAALIEGYDETVKFERSQTLMEGASHCDFHYRKKG